MTMKYREIEYALVEGIGGHLWKWSASVDGQLTGQSHTKAGAVAAAEKSIDRAFAVKKVRLVPPNNPLDAQITSAALVQAMTAIDRFEKRFATGGLL